MINGRIEEGYGSYENLNQIFWDARWGGRGSRGWKKAAGSLPLHGLDPPRGWGGVRLKKGPAGWEKMGLLGHPPSLGRETLGPFGW